MFCLEAHVGPLRIPRFKLPINSVFLSAKLLSGDFLISLYQTKKSDGNINIFPGHPKCIKFEFSVRRTAVLWIHISKVTVMCHV